MRFTEGGGGAVRINFNMHLLHMVTCRFFICRSFMTNLQQTCGSHVTQVWRWGQPNVPNTGLTFDLRSCKRHKSGIATSLYLACVASVNSTSMQKPTKSKSLK